MVITQEDWLDGTTNGPYNLNCDEVDEPGEYEDKWCTFEVVVSPPPSGSAYVNLHVDYGLKGPHTDMLPPDPTEQDRYLPIGGTDSPWGTWDVESTLDPAIVAIPDCQPHVFSYDEPSADPQSDYMANLNFFKKIAGVFGAVADSTLVESGVGGVEVALYRDGQLIDSFTTDEDGFYLTKHNHQGKAAPYDVFIDGSYITTVEMKKNTFVALMYDIATDTYEMEIGPGGGGGGKGGKK